MGSNAKLLLVALCGAVLATAALSAEISAVETAAYRGGAIAGSMPALPLQQQPTAAAGQAAATRLQPTKATVAAYRDKPSLKDFYYGKKADEYAAPGAAYGAPGYSAQYPNPAYQNPAAGTAYYAPQQPQYAAYQQPVYQQPAVQQPVYQQPVVYQQPAPQQPVYQQPEQGYYQQPAPAPYQKPAYYPAPAPAPAPAPYYTPTPKPYYGKPAPAPAPPAGICQSEVFGAYYTQVYDDVITPDHELAGVVSAYMGCKDRLTLGGMCSYTCYDGNYLERFVGVTTKITTMPPQDWDNVDPWDHPVYCAWDLGHMAQKALKQAPTIKQGDIPVGFNFSCDFTIKAICCDDIVPHVPYGGDVDLGDGGTDGCTDDSCDGGGGSDFCDANPDDACCTCDPVSDDPATGCGDECAAKTTKKAKKTGGAKKGASKTRRGSSNNGKSSSGARNGKRAKVANVGSFNEVGFTSIGNDKVTGGVRTPKMDQLQETATALQAAVTTAAQPAQITPAAAAAAAVPSRVPVVAQGSAPQATVSIKVPMKPQAAAGKADSSSL